jgi:hypothetical protein
MCDTGTLTKQPSTRAVQTLLKHITECDIMIGTLLGFWGNKKGPGKMAKSFCAEKGMTMPKKSHAATTGMSENPSCIVMFACSTATQHGMENCDKHAEIAPPAT